MSRVTAGPEIDRLIRLLARLPGLGPRSARKAALALLKRREDLLVPLSEALLVAAERLVTCPTCGNIDTTEPCAICRDESRSGGLLIVVGEVGDLWALERSEAIKARYHVLGGHLSPLDGVGPDALNVPSLVERVAAGGVTEVLLALDATVEGQSTAHFVTDALAGTGVAVSRLAQGVPIGGELDYLDEGTLSAAIKSRLRVERA